ncbi:hypothetical protein NPIL_518421 [Nephila pilipes]|uniref:Uncharacterized protein n=1 Tax=Nephila pilipes TaxID=299642 RepID=A0A8X6UKQ7_NEPPI|nr:hypothetical protein NPIL_518421 [Nephila pilipes]
MDLRYCYVKSSILASSLEALFGYCDTYPLFDVGMETGTGASVGFHAVSMDGSRSEKTFCCEVISIGRINTSQQNRSFQNDPGNSNTMTQVSIPEIQGLVNNLSTSDQCLHADSKIAEYLHSIPQINFLNQEEKSEYTSHLYTLQEEVRGKFNLYKSEEIRQETEKFKNLINTHGASLIQHALLCFNNNRGEKTALR